MELDDDAERYAKADWGAWDKADLLATLSWGICMHVVFRDNYLRSLKIIRPSKAAQSRPVTGDSK